MENILKIDSVGTYFNLRNYELLHPLISTLDYSKLNLDMYSNNGYDGLQFECYAVFLKDSKACKMKYGGQHYDYDEGTMVFIGPNQTVGLTKDPNYVPKGCAIIFHPDLLLGTDLGKKIQAYNFFSYSVKEALHLSTKERKVILSLFEKIQFELEQNLDKHSKKLIVANLELLLDYCLRFYDRQFLTREVAHTTSLEKFDVLLNEYFSSDQPKKLGLPSVTHFAEQLRLSPNYFGDLVKKETGRTAQEYIQGKLIDVAKEKVFDPQKNISEIAYELGFKYPQHFSRLFKNKTGLSPNDFRNLN
ncbi:helix-turn-helix transcriptional regulator [Aureisphaera galaxeae]|nr:response regulator transcription factor [Aureisphaera galaxeae]MDC8005848.1 helix-turn-helix transcriptional regulator [Aureisphaera galaxeae]